MGKVIKIDFKAEHRRRARERRNDMGRDAIFKFVLFVVPATILIGVSVLAAAAIISWFR